MEALAIPFLLFVGSLLALQAGANVQLSGALGSPIGASTLQLAIGAGLLLALAALAGTLGAFGALADAEPAHLWGGIGSAVYITAGILLFPRLGALVAVGLFIAGQMGASLAARRLGLAGRRARAARAVRRGRCARGGRRHLDDRSRAGRRRLARRRPAQPRRLGGGRPRRRRGAAGAGRRQRPAARGR